MFKHTRLLFGLLHAARWPPARLLRCLRTSSRAHCELGARPWTVRRTHFLDVPSVCCSKLAQRQEVTRNERRRHACIPVHLELDQASSATRTGRRTRRFRLPPGRPSSWSKSGPKGQDERNYSRHSLFVIVSDSRIAMDAGPRNSQERKGNSELPLLAAGHPYCTHATSPPRGPRELT